MIQDFLIPFVAVGLAELGDKTQLSIILISSKTKEHFQLLLGVMLGFLLVDGFAVFAGSYVTGIVPAGALKIAAGIVFIIFGLLVLWDCSSDSGKEFKFKNAFASGFALIAVAEWGDKTQIASGLLAVEYTPFLVLAGTMVALGLLSVAAVYVGGKISQRIDRNIVAKMSGVMFISLGLVSFIVK